MRFSLLPLLGALSLASGATLTLRVPGPPAVPNPNALPPSTHATLSTLGQPSHSAPLSTSNTFVFRNISAGSYLADVHCPTIAFAPLRVDVGEGGDVKVWETFRGNDWDNKGEALPKGIVGYEVRPLGVKSYFMERSKFSVLSILKNPMILLGLVSCGLFMGMPYLVKNMDPEMKAEWEESQKNNPVSGILGAAAGKPGPSPMQNFDMASFLAGAPKKDNSGSSTPVSYSDAAKSGGGGGKKGKR